MLKIGVDFHGVADTPGAFENLEILKRQGHSLYLISFSGRKRSIETQLFIQRHHPNIFIRTIYVKKREYKAKICQRYALDLMLDDNIDILQSIPVINTIHFRYGDVNPYHDPVAKFTAYTWEEAMEIISKSLPLYVYPDNSIDLATLIHYV